MIKTTDITFMPKKPTYNELERKIKKLEKEALEYMRKEKELSEERNFAEYGHMKRTISLMKINEELNREINEIKSGDNKKLDQISHKLRGRIKELNCLYDISSFRASNDFSLDGILQEMVDFIPPACQYPETTYARIIFDDYEFTTENFLYTSMKQSFSITVHNKQIGVVEVGHIKAKAQLDSIPFLEEEESLFRAIAESIARLVEREWAEIEIRKCRNRIEKLIKQTQ